MARVVRFVELILHNFTSHRSLTLNYGDINKLSGQNGQGKTSIGTAPAWILWGVDLFGGRFNPTPLNYGFDRVFASIVLSIDGTPYKFAREIEGGANAFYLNDVPAKAKEYETAVAALFDRDEFLSFYNPSYFFAQHWTKQREMVMRYTTPPPRVNVLAEMSRTDKTKETPSKEVPLNPAAAKLLELLQKHSLDDLVKIHGGTGGQKSKLEKQSIAAKSKTATLRAQLAQTPETAVDLEAVKANIALLNEQIAAAEKKKENDPRLKLSQLQASFDGLAEQIKAAKDEHAATKALPIEDTCMSCGQVLTLEALTVATETHAASVKRLADKANALVEDAKKVKAELDALKASLTAEEEEATTLASLYSRKADMEADKRIAEQRESLKAQVKQAEEEEATTLASLKESLFILDAVKAYRAKEAELQADKVQSLFTTLSIRLFKYVKDRDEWDPDFAIQMDGKDYLALSAGEKIAAGLEFAEVLFNQSQMITPIFIDGIGEYTGKVVVFGQLITGRAVPDQTLKIETEAA